MPSPKKINFSIFLKLIILIIIFTVLVNISIGFIVRLGFDRGPFRRPNKLSYMFNEYFIKDIGNPPDTVKAKTILDELGTNIRYETSGSGWTSDESVPTIDELRNNREFDDNLSTFTVRTRGRFFEIYKVDDGYVIFAPPSPRDDIDLERAIIPLVVIFTALASLLYFSLRWIFGPIKKLSEGVELISAGNFETEIEINTKDELGNLGDSINEMKINISNMIKAKESLLIDVSHELRSPLTRIKLANEFIDDGNIKNKIRDDVKEMEAMITELLETYRMDIVQEKLNTEKADIVELTKKVISKFSNSSINFKSDIEKKDVIIDKDKMEIVIRNILDNAVKYSAGKPVDVSILNVPAGKNEVSLSVRDKGKGIEKEEIKNIFEPFYRIDKSRGKKIRGYGLGLSIVKKILDLHNSTIEVKSKPDEGTEFIINFKNSQ